MQKWLTLIRLQKKFKKNTKSPQILDNPYRILIIVGGSRSGKTTNYLI